MKRRELGNYLRQLSNIKFLGLASLILIIYSFFFMAFLNYLEIDYSGDNEIIKGMPLPVLFILVVFISPLLETFIFQAFIIELILLLSNSIRSTIGRSFLNCIAIFISALTFGLSHYFNFWYFSETFFGGIILGYVFFHARVFDKNPSFWKAYFLTSIVHSNKNLFSFIYNEF